MVSYPFKAPSAHAPSGVQIIDRPRCPNCGATRKRIRIYKTRQLSTNPTKHVDGMVAPPGTPKNKLPIVRYYTCRECFDLHGNPTAWKVIVPP